MITINIKPLSVNGAFQGKKFKTPKYKAFETEMLYKLPKLEINPADKLKLSIVFGFSNKLSDIDNPVKMLSDCLVKKYGFDDRQIYELHVIKEIVKKGSEFISFEITYIK